MHARRAAERAVLALSLLPSAALAVNISVGTTADGATGCSLRSAIRTSQNAPTYAGIGGCTAGSAGVDRIVLPAGTYRLTAGTRGEDASIGGDLDILESVIVDGANRSTTIIDGDARDRVFHLIGGGVSAEIRDVTIRNGDAGDDDGGGIYVLEGATLVADNITVSGSVSTIGGGGIDALGDFIITSSSIEGNRSQNDGGLRCLTSCTGELRDSIVRDNYANGAVGGGLGAAGNLLIERTQIVDNVHEGYLGAGGLSCLQLAGNSNLIVVRDSLIAGNQTTGFGGGIRVDLIGGYFDGAPNVVVINTTIVGNTAARGGGVSIGAGAASLASVTIADNSAGHGGGVYQLGGTLGARNTIVARNGADLNPDCEGTIASQGYVLVGNDSGCNLGSAAGNRSGSAGAPIDVRLAAAVASNGGATPTLATQPFSTVINGGDPAGCTDGSSALANDQRGSGYPRAQGGRCDLGAYEQRSCGNGVLEAGEACDGAILTNGCCTTPCQFAALYSSCNDGNSSTILDSCRSNGVCRGLF